MNDVYAAGHVKERAFVSQTKTHKPVRFEITETTRLSLERWIRDPECPKHNGRFDIRDGVPRRAPVCVALRPYPAKVEGGRILVNLPD